MNKEQQKELRQLISDIDFIQWQLERIRENRADLFREPKVTSCLEEASSALQEACNHIADAISDRREIVCSTSKTSAPSAD